MDCMFLDSSRAHQEAILKTDRIPGQRGQPVLPKLYGTEELFAVHSFMNTKCLQDFLTVMVSDSMQLKSIDLRDHLLIYPHSTLQFLKSRTSFHWSRSTLSNP